MRVTCPYDSWNCCNKFALCLQPFLTAFVTICHGTRNKESFHVLIAFIQDTDGTGLTDLEIRNEVDTFMFEGHDTTQSGMTWILYSLARFPDHQEQCRQEIDEILKGRGTDEIEW